MSAAETKITFASLSLDNEELQTAMDNAIATVRDEWLGAEVPMLIDGDEVHADQKRRRTSPIDHHIDVCVAQMGTAAHIKAAIGAARRAQPAWEATPWQERVAIVREAAEIMSRRSLELSALLIFEVGKSRLEAIGEVNEATDLLRWYAGSMEDNNGFVRVMGRLDPDDDTENNVSVLRPYGVWGVISPFNFPVALSAAPTAAALVTGNTVVAKGSSDTPHTNWKVAEIFRDAGVPAGVLANVAGAGGVVGAELLANPEVDGWTFTGSYEVGMTALKAAAGGTRPRPTIIEMGGKNPAIVSNTADLDKAALGVMRAAFAMDGQKCSACSRVYVQSGVFDEFKSKLLSLVESAIVGNPTHRDIFMGTVIHEQAYEDYQRYVDQARTDGTVVFGGNIVDEGDLARGLYVEPAIIEGLAEEHDLVKKELFLPILHLAAVESLSDAMEKANDTTFGLTAGFFGEDASEIEWFLDNIEAGTVYVNREASATTGGWPGVQCFGGWKASGSSGKGIGGHYTLSLYMQEQSRTIIG